MVPVYMCVLVYRHFVELMRVNFPRRESLPHSVSVMWRKSSRHFLFAFVVGKTAFVSRSGKSYMLTTVFLWCLLNNKQTRAAAPTGIAAANIEIEGTDVQATTIHNLFDLDSEFKSKLDFAKPEHSKVASLLKMDVLLLDEVSMMDTDCWSSIAELMSMVDHSKRPDAVHSDALGSTHVILMGALLAL